MLNAPIRLIVTVVNLIFLAIIPLVCRFLAVNAGRAQPYLATISGHYLQAPERYIFAGGVALFVLVHISISGLLSASLPQATDATRQYCQTLEMVLLGAFLLIACAPAHIILGLHASLGALLVGISLLWMSTILQHVNMAQPIWYWLGNATLIVAVIAAIGMITSFPIDVVSQLVASRGDLDRTFFLLAMDQRWFIFACFEWSYYYCIIVFMLTMACCTML